MEANQPITLTDLKDALKGLAKQETVTALADTVDGLKGTVDVLMEAVAEIKEDVTGLMGEVTGLKEDSKTTKGILSDMMEELTATHADVRNLDASVATLVRNDTAQDTTLANHTKRIKRLEQKAGLAS